MPVACGFYHNGDALAQRCIMIRWICQCPGQPEGCHWHESRPKFSESLSGRSSCSRHPPGVMARAVAGPRARSPATINRDFTKR
eukprot:2043737-Rhodomonas_salina.1